MQRIAAIQLGIGFLVGISFIGGAEPPEVGEYQVKAAYLFNFSKFVEWPPKSFSSASSPIVICILGEDPFAGSLEEAIRNKTVAGRGLIVRSMAGLADGKSCHMLFVGLTEWRHSHPAIANLTGSGVLTVGETTDFTTSGGMIAFKLDAGRVRFQINLAAIRRAPVQISSKLLSLAEIVGPRE
jgi:hypothetical protein